MKPIVIEDSCCKQVSLPRFVSGQGRTVLRVNGIGRRAAGITGPHNDDRLHQRRGRSQVPIHVYFSIAICDVWSLKRRISSLEGLIRSNPTRRLLLGTGIGDSYSGLQQVPWLGVSHFAMCILPTEAQPLLPSNSCSVVPQIYQSSQ